MAHNKHKPLPKNRLSTNAQDSTIKQQDSTVKQAVDNKYLHNIINLSMPEDETGKSMSFYLSSDAIKTLKKYMKVNHIKNQSKLIDTVIKTFLKIEE